MKIRTLFGSTVSALVATAMVVFAVGCAPGWQGLSFLKRTPVETRPGVLSVSELPKFLDEIEKMKVQERTKWLASLTAQPEKTVELDEGLQMLVLALLHKGFVPKGARIMSMTKELAEREEDAGMQTLVRHYRVLLASRLRGEADRKGLAKSVAGQRDHSEACVEEKTLVELKELKKTLGEQRAGFATCAIERAGLMEDNEALTRQIEKLKQVEQIIDKR